MQLLVTIAQDKCICLVLVVARNDFHNSNCIKRAILLFSNGATFYVYNVCFKLDL